MHSDNNACLREKELGFFDSSDSSAMQSVIKKYSSCLLLCFVHWWSSFVCYADFFQPSN